ncbi:hypothetical protein TURU_093246 [Turdus rufiventris]|nr:hypothetical protein TURU_093246 [Turdus rufiventris]
MAATAPWDVPRAETKTGIALLYDEVSENAYDIRLKLTKEVLTIQKQDVICVSGSDHSANVNGINVESATHEEVLRLTCISGEKSPKCSDTLGIFENGKVTLPGMGLHVSGRNFIPETQHVKEKTGMRGVTSKLALIGNIVGDLSRKLKAPSSPSSPIANEPKYEKRWLDTLSVPLSMARISRYKTGTDKLRSNAFEVLALDGVSTGILQFYTAQESADWLRAMSTNISDLTLQNSHVQQLFVRSPADAGRQS